MGSCVDGLKSLTVKESDREVAVLKKKLPIAGQRNVLITSALPYVNNVPHLGNLVGAVLSADVYARYLRQRGTNCIYICGTDEYGTATETKAQEEKMTPREICDKYNALHRGVYEWFDIAFDHFGRTSTPEQTEICQEIFWSSYKNGFVSEGELRQPYCTTDMRFLADRYVTGTCPKCGYEDARGDQCDNCGSLLNAIELIAPKCSTCGMTPEIRHTKHLFLELPQLRDELEAYVKKTSKEGSWTQNSISMTESWLREGDGLQKRCITRDLSWGTKVPLEGYTDKVFYVWFDAPIGYLSITATYSPEWRKWWCDDSGNVELVQFMGKDNVPFHTIIFPSTLMSTREKWTLMHHISTTEYLNYEDGKFSKRKGVGVFGTDAKDTGIPPEVWRYYLLSNRPELADSTFLWSDFAAKNNDELLKNLGNFINRTVMFLSRNFGGKMPKVDLNELDRETVAEINEELKQYIAAMDKVSLKAGVKRAMLISKIGNAYLQSTQPWVLEKTDKERCGSVLGFAANLVHLLADILEPFLGGLWSEKVLKMLGVVHSPGSSVITDEFQFKLQEGQALGEPVLLFRELKTGEIDALRTKYAGSQSERIRRDEVVAAGPGFPLDIRVGVVKEVIEHPESNYLFICKVDVGEESGPRELVAGLREFYKTEELQNRKVVVVCNLAPALLAGINSQGMMLTAEKKKAVKLLEVGPDGEIGEHLAPAGVPVQLGTALDRKAFQAASKGLRIGAEGYVFLDKTFALETERTGTRAYGGGVSEGGKIK